MAKSAAMMSLSGNTSTGYQRVVFSLVPRVKQLNQLGQPYRWQAVFRPMGPSIATNIVYLLSLKKETRRVRRRKTPGLTIGSPSQLEPRRVLLIFTS